MFVVFSMASFRPVEARESERGDGSSLVSGLRVSSKLF